MELLERIIKENNIPKDVHFMSDSGWECDPTEMDGVFYNRQSNTIVFTQGGLSERRYEGLLKIRREESETPPPVYSFVREMEFPEKLISTVRVENEYSKKRMRSCGFHDNTEKIASFRIFMDDEGTEQGFVQICEFIITKDEYLNGGRK